MAYKSEIEALVLSALADGPLHGYRITQAIKARSSGLLKLGDNQIYPTLHRLELENLIDAEWQPQEGKPARKVYSLTPEGRRRLEQRQQEWKQYAANFAIALGLGGGHA
ncbi:MAG TPA: helix-turn-helix transcriptional regulator [Fimbriimonas sp.]|nr:helix-turn-helix transcriptional regulator [Fimbriimonas sp.]